MKSPKWNKTSETSIEEAAVWLSKQQDVPSSLEAIVENYRKLHKTLEKMRSRMRGLQAHLARAMGLSPQSEKEKPKQSRKEKKSGKRRSQASIKRQVAALLRESACLKSEETGMQASYNEKAVVDTLERLCERGKSEETEADRELCAQPQERVLATGGCVTEEVEIAYDLKDTDKPAKSKQVSSFYEIQERIDMNVTLSRVTVHQDVQVFEKDGERIIKRASIQELGPKGMKVTWNFLSQLVLLVVGFAVPLNRISGIFQTPSFRLSTASLCRYLSFVARRSQPVYLQLAKELANSSFISGDDTSTRVLEVNEQKESSEPKWKHYRDSDTALAFLRIMLVQRSLAPHWRQSSVLCLRKETIQVTK